MASYGIVDETARGKEISSNTLYGMFIPQPQIAELKTHKTPKTKRRKAAKIDSGAIQYHTQDSKAAMLQSLYCFPSAGDAVAHRVQLTSYETGSSYSDVAIGSSGTSDSTSTGEGDTSDVDTDTISDPSDLSAGAASNSDSGCSDVDEDQAPAWDDSSSSEVSSSSESESSESDAEEQEASSSPCSSSSENEGSPSTSEDTLQMLEKIRELDDRSLRTLARRLVKERAMKQKLGNSVGAQWKRQQVRVETKERKEKEKQEKKDRKNTQKTANDNNNSKKKKQQRESPSKEQQQQQQQRKGPGPTEWNARFQAALTDLRTLGFSPEKKILSYQTLSRLAQDFVVAAKTYGQIIISEVYADAEQKTIKPIALGGFAGGEKYIVNNILFKFAVDTVGIYGSDEIAMKVAGHELKGLMSYFNLDLHGIHFPLMALVDYLGFRVIAMSILPISKSTIVYGTADAGMTIFTEDPEMNAIIERGAERLGLKPHLAGGPPRSPAPKMVWSAADIEGHMGTDGRRYLLDFSRTFPPRQRDENMRNSHLYQLFRPEFLRGYPKRLCSDAYSGFVPHYDSAEHIIEIQEATKYLRKKIIPKLAVALDESAHRSRDQARLEAVSQRASSPVPLAKSGAADDDGSKKKGSGLRSWRRNREIRGTRFRDRIRHNKKSVSPTGTGSLSTLPLSSTPVPSPHHSPLSVSSPAASLSLASEDLTLAGSSSSAAAAAAAAAGTADGRLYGIDVKRSLHEVGVNLRYIGLVRRYCWDDGVRTALMLEMLARSIKHILRKKTRSLMRRLKAPVFSPFRALIVDTLNLVFGSSEQSTTFWNTKLKSELIYNFPWSLTSEERDDKNLDMKSLLPKEDVGRLCVAVVRQAEVRLRAKFLEELLGDPQLLTHPQPFDETDLEEIDATVRHMNIMELAQGYVLKQKGRQSMLEGTRSRLFTMALEKFEGALARNATDTKTLREMADTAFLLKNEALADHYYRKLLARDPSDAISLFKYATFLEAVHRDDLAEEVYLQALEADLTNDHCFQTYGSFLDAHGEHELAESFFFRASDLRSIKRDLEPIPDQNQKVDPLTSPAVGTFDFLSPSFS